ncbi:helix-turn-helix transcriptional regulator [Streptomyces sp. SP18CS02]|uniref:helix-turn-helix transcriptional regulator n=1 Tax=Streptomyces sp. SP18CS02 TaxID=3002531 RepID=UPI002E77FDF7|nr:LuxR C-terminal-related transcriptional regulator [Streptomyces sp. SP18CS02]MEE1756463.1 LuxR C-terminal-related transcriptional regulator [Streptomyces sp. SP18CS02]
MFVTSLDLPLRGRECELSYIRDVLEFGRSQGSALLVVEAPPGFGKTRLLRACAAMAEEMGYATPGSTQPGHREAVSWSRHRRLPSPRGGGPRRQPGANAPLLLLLDEADRLGGGAADTLLSRRAGLHGSPAVSVVAHRSGRAPEALGAILASPTGRRAHLALSPLPPSACLQVATDILGLPPSPALVELLDEVEGNPRLLVAMLTGLREEQSLSVVDGRAHLAVRRLPQRLRDQVDATLDTFSPECRHLLRMAAVLGEELEYEVLAPMLRTSPSGLFQLLEEAVATGAVRSDGIRTVFGNALLRRLIAGSVPASLQRALRREAEEKRRPRAPATDVAARGAVPLNDRQSAVVRLVGEGLTNQQIARRLEVSPHTVNYHLRKLFYSYGVRSRIDLLRAVERQARQGAGR